MKWWFWCLPVVVLVAMVNPLSGGGGLQAEKKLQKPIREYIEQHGRCTYDELGVWCMSVKIHLGIDSAIEKMLRYKELVQEEDGQFRLPTDEDRKNGGKSGLKNTM